MIRHQGNPSRTQRTGMPPRLGPALMGVTPNDGLGAVGVAAMSASARAGLGGEKRVCGVPRSAGRRNPALGWSGEQDGKRQGWGGFKLRAAPVWG